MSENQLIVLAQKPIIEYSAIEARGIEVAEKIALMNLDTIEPTEQNRSVMKRIRAELNKDLEVFERQRKMIHEAITKPYKDFTASYDEHIKVLYKNATEQLKEKISSVEAAMLDTKKSDIEAYFNSVAEHLDFISIDDAGLNIILSVPNKKLMGQIDGFVTKISHELATIGGMDNSVRIESLYKTNLGLSLSVSTVNDDIKREKELQEKKLKEAKEAEEREEKRVEEERVQREVAAKERFERKEKEAKQLEQKRINAKKNAELNKTKEVEQEAGRLKNEKIRADEELEIAKKESQRIQAEKEEKAKAEAAEAEIHKMTFTVSGNIKQLKQIKTFLNELGVSYE
ncbi:MAG: DUF1351 domain-containing protein [Gammaproteobacteria bacterium]|nr:DUF1351 domain-containing protein [Gammaproteobacteria bacterium]